MKLIKYDIEKVHMELPIEIIDLIYSFTDFKTALQHHCCSKYIVDKLFDEKNIPVDNESQYYYKNKVELLLYNIYNDITLKDVTIGYKWILNKNMLLTEFILLNKNRVKSQYITTFDEISRIYLFSKALANLEACNGIIIPLIALLAYN